MEIPCNTFQNNANYSLLFLIIVSKDVTLWPPSLNIKSGSWICMHIQIAFISCKKQSVSRKAEGCSILYFWPPKSALESNHVDSPRGMGGWFRSAVTLVQPRNIFLFSFICFVTCRGLLRAGGQGMMSYFCLSSSSNQFSRCFPRLWREGLGQYGAKRS